LKVEALNKIKRNKPLMILLLPVIVCIFFAGWVMYIAGRPGSGTPQKIKQVKPASDNVTIGVLPIEESQEIKAE
jgi:hypothetical protein